MSLDNRDILFLSSSLRLIRIAILVNTLSMILVIVAGTILITRTINPKIERAVTSVESIEDRFHLFADEVQPVLTAGAGKTIEAIRGLDAKSISEKATERLNRILDSDKD